MRGEVTCFLLRFLIKNKVKSRACPGNFDRFYKNNNYLLPSIQLNHLFIVGSQNLKTTFTFLEQNIRLSV